MSPMYEDMYTTREEAVAELKRRRQDKDLMQQVNAYLGGDVPAILQREGINTVLWRHIVTPDSELEMFLDFNKEMQAQPVLFEYLEDTFVARNRDKYALARLMFYINTAANGQVNTISTKVIDFSGVESRQLADIKTVWGEPLVSFHHKFFLHYHPQLSDAIYDLSRWLHAWGSRARDFYPRVFALFITHGIQFDNYRDEDVEGPFVRDVAYPAFCEVRDRFKLKPLISPLQPTDNEDDPRWWTYPLERKVVVEQLIHSYRPQPTPVPHR